MISSDRAARLWEVARVFLKIGSISYGGPAIMGIIQAEIQEKRQWLTKERFVEGLALVNMLPGAGTTQLGIYVGYQRAGFWGGVLAGLSFMLPAFLIMMALTLTYATVSSLPLVRHAFYGLGPVVLAIFAVALYRLGRATVKSKTQVVIVLAAAALFSLTPIGVIPVLLLAACAGVAVLHSRRAGIAAAVMVALLIALAETIAQGAVSSAPASGNPLWDLGVFFFKVGAFTFGGGLSMIAFIQEQVVGHYQWLTTSEFLDGLALGQVTPGPILMLAAFVGFKVAGLGGAVLSAAAIFLPSFILVLAVIPILAKVREVKWIAAALKGIGAAVIGVLFVALAQMSPHAVPDAFALAVFALALAGMLAWRLTPLPAMAAGAVAGINARFRRAGEGLLDAA